MSRGGVLGIPSADGDVIASQASGDCWDEHNIEEGKSLRERRPGRGEAVQVRELIKTHAPILYVDLALWLRELSNNPCSSIKTGVQRDAGVASPTEIQHAAKLPCRDYCSWICQ